MKLAELFQDHMVIQRDKPFFIWGTGEDGEEVRVTVGQETRETRVKAKQWKLEFPPMAAARDLTIQVVSGDKNIMLRNVAAGEVWLAGGQSNMEFFMLFDEEYEKEKLICENADLRFYDIPEISYPEQREDFDFSQMGYWRKCTPEDLKYYSAAAYYFQKKLSSDLHIPIGIIGCNWGGTTASCWMSEKYLERHGKPWIDDYQEQVRKISDLEAYKAMYRKHPINDKGHPFADPFIMKMMSVTTREEQLEMMKNTSEEFQMLLNSPYDPNRPCGLFEMMVKQAAGYGIRGVIWYQGESDEVHAEIYRDIFLDLVDCWRELWGECLPFLTVQLAPFETWLGNSGERFPEIRRQQRMAAEEKEIYLISISDAGMRYDIHPKRKRPVGERLAMMAEEQLYGMNILGHAPEAREAFAGEDSIAVHFNYAGDGLKIVGDTLNAVCVTDSSGRIRKIASFRVEKDILYLTPEDYRRESYAIEFAQTPFYEVNLYNSSDLPALPFLLIARS